MAKKKSWYEEETFDEAVNSLKNKNKNVGKEFTMSSTQKIFIGLIVVTVLFCLALGPQLIEIVPAGEYKICQSAFTGKLDAWMKPGPYGQWFGSIYEYPCATTFFFTADKEGGPEDTSIEVQFYDGSKCRISGTCRIEYPKDGSKLIDLLESHGFRSENELEQKLILPVVRRSLVMSANGITAKESYAEKRAEFISDVKDQIQNGVYMTKDEEVKTTDLQSGQNVTRIKKTKITNKDGVIVRDANPLEGLGLLLSNFEIKKFVYDPIVTKQIETQQEATMSVQTALANAKAAEQKAITAEAEGKANVMKAKYEKETLKAQALVEAEQSKEVAATKANQEKEVALIGAQKLVAVAEQDKLTAEIKLKIADLDKQAQILKGEGEASYKNKVFMADGGLVPKLEAMIAIQKEWATAFATRKVPTIVSGGSGKGGTDTDAMTFMDLLTAQTAQQLALKMDQTPVTPVAMPAAVK